MQHHLHHRELVEVGVEQRLDDHARPIVTFGRMCGRYALHSNPEVVALQFTWRRSPPSRRATTSRPPRRCWSVQPDGAALLRWGWRGKAHNLRAETVAQPAPPLPASRRAASTNGSSVGAGKQPYYVRPARERAVRLRRRLGRRNLRHPHRRARTRRCAPSTIACRRSSRAQRLRRAGSAARTACSRRRRTTTSSRTRSARRSTAAAAESPRLIEPLPSGVAAAGAAAACSATRPCTPAPSRRTGRRPASVFSSSMRRPRRDHVGVAGRHATACGCA